MIDLQAARLAAAASGARERAAPGVSSPHDAARGSRYSTRAPRLAEAGRLPFWLAGGVAASDEVLRRFEENVLQTPGRELVPEQSAQALDDADKGLSRREAEFHA